MILLTGFGPFPGVARNPSAELVRALDGARVQGHVVLGEVLPVSYARGPQHTLAVARKHGVVCVLGMGVATSRQDPEVEAVARRLTHPELPDVDGVVAPALPPGPERVLASVDAEGLARAMGCRVSTDAGAYVCNAWLYAVGLGLPGVPVGFVHIPASGMEPQRVLRGLEVLARGR